MKIANSIVTILVYKWNTMWVFDYDAVGLVKEPFVAGADTLMDKLSEGADKVSVTFSKYPFPGIKIRINKVDKEVDGKEGTNYYCPQLDHKLWLCPALLLFFDFPPDTIYIQYKPIHI